MEKQGDRDNQQPDPVKIWTLRIQGEPEFAITLPGNPSLDHDGSLTLWKISGSFHLVSKAVDLIQAIGPTVDVFTEEQTPEQAKERDGLLTGTLSGETI